jgi:transporter family-2 protein
MKNLLLLMVALFAGGLVPVQGSINAHLSKGLNHPLQATFISFFGAVLLLVVVLMALNPALPTLSQLRSIPPIYYTGGIYGVLFVTTLLVLTPHIGIASTVVATIVGQLILSVILDHLGLFGLARHPLSLSRLIGSAGLLVSLYLIQKG